MYKKFAAIVLAIMVILGTVNKSFAYDNNVNSKIDAGVITDTLNGWDGENTEVSYYGENYKITYKLNDYWNNGYNVEVSVENTGDTNIVNWILEMPLEGEITNIWNADVKNKNDDKYIIKYQSWNRTISAGTSIKFGFTGIGAFNGFPFVIKLINGNVRTESSESCELIYRIDDEWDNGFNASIVIVNKTEKTIEDWMIEFDYACEIKEVWNGRILNHEKNHYVMGNSGYNAVIQPDDSVVIGFLGENGNMDEVPYNYSLSELKVDISTSSDSYIAPEEKTTEEIDTEDIFDEEKTTEIQTTEENTTEELISNNNESKINSLTIDTEGLFFNEKGLFYVVDSEMNLLSGTLSYVDGVNGLEYSVIDLYGNVVKRGNIKVQKKWVVSDFALVLGYNKVEVRAISKEEIVTTVDFFNTYDGNETNIDVDKSDDDGDGLNNYQEIIYGTNKDIKDTDGDGLTDYEECLFVGTEPLTTDSDDNGILDSEEDFDEDGLNSIQEIKYGTYIFISDSDQDGLNDGDEVKNYATNPMSYDTDDDDLSDASELELGFSPLLADSDGNGILDGKESIEQIYEEDFEEQKNPGITGIDLQTDCSGNINDKVIVVNAYGLDTLASSVTGLIGDPIDITLDTEFDEAKLSFHYNEAELGDAKEEDLAIAWHDKKNDEIVLLEDSIVDKENNTVSYVTNHFSTYMVVNKKIFDYPQRISAAAPPVGMGKGVNLVFRAPALGSSTSREYKITNVFLNDIINEMEDDDRFEISAYNGTSGIFSSDMMYLKNISRSIFSGKPSASLNNPYNPLMDIVYCVNSFDNPRINGNSKGSVYILMCDGKDTKYDKMLEYYAGLAKSQGIAIYFLNYGSEDCADMKMLAHKAGGYYKKLKDESDATWAAKMIMAHNFIEDDYDPFAGQSFREDKRELPDDFIFVDGTENKDGRIIYGGLTYLSYPNGFIDLKYKKPINVIILKRDKYFIGAAGVHDCCSDVLRDINYKLINENENVTADDFLVLSRIQSDKELSTEIGIGISTLTGIDGTALDVYTSYITGKGGDEKAADPQYTRKTIDVEKYIRTSNKENSAREYYAENIKKTILAAESVISNDNTDITFSSSETSNWKGCLYYEDIGDWKENIKHNTMSVASNIAAFGTFNDASASITAHCNYNPQTEEYTMDVRYYILDYYDYSFLDELYELDAVGIAQSYELVGSWNHTVKWKKGESDYTIY